MSDTMELRKTASHDRSESEDDRMYAYDPTTERHPTPASVGPISPGQEILRAFVLVFGSILIASIIIWFAVRSAERDTIGRPRQGFRESPN